MTSALPSTAPELAAFAGADFRRTRAPADVWTDAAGPLLHADVVEGIVAEVFAEARAPAGLALTGPAGAGKTHVLAELRRRVVDGGGWLVRIDLFGAGDFAGAAAQGFADSLLRRTQRGATQAGAVLLAALKALSADPAALKAAAAARPQLAKVNAVEMMLAMLAAREPNEAARYSETVRTLAQLDSPDASARGVAAQWLQGDPAAPAEIVRGLLWSMALAGPTLIVVDGVDALAGEAGAGALLEAIGAGLAELHGASRRGLTLASCLKATWDGLKKGALAPFREISLGPLASADHVERLIASRLAPAWAGAGLATPYPAYPFTAAAIASAVGLTPREILLRCRRHQDDCVAEGEVRECESLADPLRGEPPATPLHEAQGEALDEAFARGLDSPAPPRGEAAVATWLIAACELYLRQFRLPEAVGGEVVADAAPSAALHARLALIEENGRQLSFGFRAIAEPEGPAFRARLEAAMAAAGLEAGQSGRKLVILLDGPPPVDPLVQSFLDAGGQFLAPTPEDFTIVAALRALERRRGFDAWLRLRKPLMDTRLFHAAGLVPPGVAETPPARPPPRKLPPPIASTAAAAPPHAAASLPNIAALAALATREPPAPAEIFVGRSAQLGELVGPVALSAALLPRHIAVFADTAGGRCGFLSRLVEEAALIGAPALVLDVDNEFARLGEPWPSRPTDFSDDDARRAKLFFERVEVVVWTPGVSGGRPISLPALPDFSALRHDDSESREARERAVEMTLATFEPYLPGRGAKAIKVRGALADALRAFARAGGGGVDDLMRLLRDLPTTASRNAEAAALTREIAEANAANSLLASRGPPFDLAELFAGPTRKTRVSVVNLSGLAERGARAAFVNQLQMALFFWVRRHPGPRLFVLDEAQLFAPVKETTPAKRSALALLKQASPSGLGIVAGAAAPQALDPAIAGLCLTQVFGRARAPENGAAIAAAMAAKGGAADDLGRLRTGELFFFSEGYARPIKIRAPLSLSRRTAIAPTAAEVAAIARRTA